MTVLSGPRRTLLDVGLLVIRGIVGWEMFYHGSQKLFGWFVGGFWTADEVPAPAATIQERIDGFAGGLEGMGIPYPEVNAWVAACTEFGGGLLLMLGLLTRVAGTGVAIAMGVAVTFAHAAHYDARANGMELALLLMCVAIGLVFTGPGRISLDAALFRGKKTDDANHG